jgi:hypothetical protein
LFLGLGRCEEFGVLAQLGFRWRFFVWQCFSIHQRIRHFFGGSSS